jgi:hypothetical protein
MSLVKTINDSQEHESTTTPMVTSVSCCPIQPSQSDQRFCLGEISSSLQTMLSRKKMARAIPWRVATNKC